MGTSAQKFWHAFDEVWLLNEYHIICFLLHILNNCVIVRNNHKKFEHILGQVLFLGNHLELSFPLQTDFEKEFQKHIASELFPLHLKENWQAAKRSLLVEKQKFFSI